MGIPYIKEEYFEEVHLKVIRDFYTPGLSRDAFIRKIKNAIKISEDLKLGESLRIFGPKEKYDRWYYHMANRFIYYYILAMMDVPYEIKII